MTECRGVSFPLIFRDVLRVLQPLLRSEFGGSLPLAAGLRRRTHNPGGLRRRASFVLPLVAPQGVTLNAASRNSSNGYMIGSVDPCSRAPRGAVGTSFGIRDETVWILLARHSKPVPPARRGTGRAHPQSLRRTAISSGARGTIGHPGRASRGALARHLCEPWSRQKVHSGNS